MSIMRCPFCNTEYDSDFYAEHEDECQDETKKESVGVCISCENHNLLVEGTGLCFSCCFGEAQL